MARSYETVEQKLIPLGVSGIEDMLQDEVAETINVGLRSVCSIVPALLWNQHLDDHRRQTEHCDQHWYGRSWSETVGRSTGIIDGATPPDHVLFLDITPERSNEASVLNQLQVLEQRMKRNSTSAPFALCVTGNFFSFVTTKSSEGDSSLLDGLLQLATQVNSVIFCRVFPKQKVLSGC